MHGVSDGNTTNSKVIMNPNSGGDLEFLVAGEQIGLFGVPHSLEVGFAEVVGDFGGRRKASKRITEHRGGDEQHRRNWTLDFLDSGEIWRHQSEIVVAGDWSKAVEASCGFLLIGGSSSDQHNLDMGLVSVVFGRSRRLGKLEKAKSGASRRRRRIEF
ncbi:hypothetical protein U1Q18_023123 [Sarracenia purpurea var. burkii]